MAARVDNRIDVATDEFALFFSAPLHVCDPAVSNVRVFVHRYEHVAVVVVESAYVLRYDVFDRKVDCI